MNKNVIKRILAFSICLTLALTIAIPAFAADQSVDQHASADEITHSETLGIDINNHAFSQTKYIDVEYSSVYNSTSTWSFPYTDEYFDQPDNAYCHEMALASFGMAASSFKCETLNNKCADNVEKYFENIGFENVSAETFFKDPTADSITYAIASKKIGKKTVIAVVCCGAGYGAEWSGNLTVGNGIRHEGFATAAATVEQGIYDYMRDYNLSGQMVLWTSGFSRAAAVSNLVAADMTDSNDFISVYCYTYAAPQTTRDDKEYDNIFNIVGKDDPVAAIPFSDWGYHRYGTDLYTPTVEMDSDYLTKASKASMIMYKIDRHYLSCNPELSAQLRTFFDYLLALIPDASVYDEELQPGVLQVMADHSSDNILLLVEQILRTFTPDTDAESAELDNLLDYIQLLINQYVLQGNTSQIEYGYWNPDLNVTQNLTSEHNPTKYMSWMFSDNNPENIFGQCQTFTHFTIKGDLDIEVYSDGIYLCSADTIENVRYSAEVSQNYSADENIYALYYETDGYQLNIIFPGDKNYSLKFKCNYEQDVEYYASSYSRDSVTSEINNIYELHCKEGDEFTLDFPKGAELWDNDLDGQATTVVLWDYLQTYSPSVVMRLQNLDVAHLTVKSVLINLAGIILFAFIELIVCITLAFARLFYHKQRHSASTIAVHIGNAAIFLAFEIAMWYFVPAYPIIHLVFKIISFLFILTLAIVALTEYASKWNAFLTLGVFLFMVLDVIFEDNLIGSFNILNLIIKIAFYALLSVAASLTWIGHMERREEKYAAYLAKIQARKEARAARRAARAK